MAHSFSMVIMCPLAEFLYSIMSMCSSTHVNQLFDAIEFFFSNFAAFVMSKIAPRRLKILPVLLLSLKAK